MSARVAAAEAAMLDAAINLGISADLLQAQLSIGDVIAAKILPAQNGQDLIDMLGLRVAAQLPPGVHPGETLLLQVTGFAGTQIYVRNLGTPDPRNPVPVNDVVLAAPESEVQQSAVPAPPRAQEPTAQTPAVSPPRAVFVAASVRQAPAAQAQTPVERELPSVPGVEARIAAAQAAKLPPIPPRTAAVQTAAVQTAAVQSVPVHAAANAAANAAAAAAQRIVRTVSEFLRAARLPDTPFTRMAAAIAPHAPERLPSVLQRLEASLPHEAQDPRIPTLRTLIGFTARLDPANAETLRAQISSYVSNVLEGVEAKLAQLLHAHTQAAPAAPRGDQPAASQTPATRTPQAQQSQEPSPAQAPLPPTLAQARVAERSAAISHDLKSVVLSLLRDPAAQRTPAMTQALTETLITLTGVQVNTLSGVQQNPGTLNFTLPVYYHEGGKPAQIRISRDADSRAANMDADNFHVAFVLDTANLGTVAIDLQASGRTVRIDVKTEKTSAAERFSDTLASLRARLEDLRYRVASTAASALAKAHAPAKPTAAEKKSGVDLRA